MSEPVGTYLVTASDEASAVVRDVETGQVHTLAAQPEPELAVGELLEARLEPEPPMELAWRVAAIERRWTAAVLAPDLEPTTQVRELGAGLAPGDLERIERAGSGEIHVVGVDDPAAAAAALVDDESVLERAGRLGAVRVEIRTGDGFVSVRYLPD